MYASLLVRSSLRRNLISQSARCFASRAPPPPSTPQIKANRKEPIAKPKQADKPANSEETRSEAPTSAPPLSSLPSLDFAPGEEPHQERTGARSSKDSLSSIERRRRLWSRVFLGVLLVGAGFQTYYMGRELDEYDLKEFRMVSLNTCLINPEIDSCYSTETRRCAVIAMGEDFTSFQGPVQCGCIFSRTNLMY